MAHTIESFVAADRDGTGAPRCRKLFSFEQAAVYAGVSPEIIVYWIRTGWLTVLVCGREPRIDQLELDACLASLEWLPAR